jgi:hypothetical protein
MNRPQSKLGTIAIVVCLVATPVAAAEFARAPQADGPDIITISGDIEQGDDKKFAELAWGVKDAIIILDSRGGYNSPAANIGLHIRSHNYETRLHSGAICNSACTLIWLAGTYRHIDKNTRLGFHSASKGDTYARFEEGNRKIAEYLTKLGTPQKVIDLQPKADPCCFNYIEYAQAKAWGLLSDRPAKQQHQALPTPETQQQVTTAPAPPKPVTTVPVRPTLPQPVPQRGLPPSAAQQPASAPPALLQPAQPDATDALVAELRAQLAEMRSQRDAWQSIAEHLALAVPKPEPPKLVPQQTLPIPEMQQPVAAPKDTQRIEPGREEAATAPRAQAAQKVVLYEEDPADPNGKRFVGSAIWRIETVVPAPGQPPELAIRADIEVPERKLAVTWSLRRNTDKGLPATHTVEIMFKLPADFPSGGISNVPGILMKQAESTRGVPLAGLAVKVTPGFYRIGLSNLDADKERNLQLLKERGWFDMPVVYNNNRRAILAMEKGAPGERVFADSFKAWKQ